MNFFIFIFLIMVVYYREYITAKQILQSTGTNNLYTPNKLYKPIEQICIPKILQTTQTNSKYYQNRIYKLPKQKNCTHRTNYTNYRNKFYKLQEQILQTTVTKFICTEKIYELTKQNVYPLNKFYKLPKQIIQTIRTNSLKFRKKLCAPNKLYELIKKIVHTE
jgi:formate dehydrogenase maturation protein FdhE